MNKRYDWYKDMVDSALSEYFKPAGDGADGLREAMRYSLLAGGKRLRPVLCLEFCRVCGTDPIQALGAACGVEMLHTYSLIHDDLPCMDNDDERRGKPSSHKKFGEATAVLAGDCLQAEAFSAVCASAIGEADKARCVRELALAAGSSGICGGQYTDLSGERPSVSGLTATDLRKTASLMGAACAMGASAAGSEEKAVDAARSFGIQLGMAFQVRDDMLDKDGFLPLLGEKQCLTLIGRYTDAALSALEAFGDTLFLRELAAELTDRVT